MKIALVDTGIDLNNSDFKILGGINLISSERKRQFQDDNGHGTYCASVIQRICPQAEFFVVKALNQDAKSSISVLRNVLKYLSTTDIRIVCLSLATLNYDNELEFLCKELVKKNMILVSSVANRELISYPAAFQGVIGVNSILMENRDMYWYNRGKNVQCIADVTPVMVPELDGTYRMFGGNSMANAFISGKIMNMLINKPSLSLDKIEHLLEMEANKVSWNDEDILSGRYNKYTREKEHLKVEKDVAKAVYDVLCECLGIGKLELVTLLEDRALNEILNPKEYYVVIKKFSDKYGKKVNYLSIDYNRFKTVEHLADYVQELLG